MTDLLPERQGLRLVGDADWRVFIETRGGERLWRVCAQNIEVVQDGDGLTEINVGAYGRTID